MFSQKLLQLNVSPNEHIPLKNCSNELNVLMEMLVLLNVSHNKHFRQKNSSFKLIFGTCCRMMKIFTLVQMNIFLFICFKMCSFELIWKLWKNYGNFGFSSNKPFFVHLF